jgi:hypothetical protein
MHVEYSSIFLFDFCSLYSFTLRDGTKLDVDQDALSSGDEDTHFPGVSSEISDIKTSLSKARLQCIKTKRANRQH